jgi:hypothetical protein
MLSNPMLWKDYCGREYTAKLKLVDAERLKQAGVDVFAEDFFQRLYSDSLSLIEIVAEAWRPQWSGQLTYEEFVDSVTLEDETLGQVRRAMEAGITDFFRRLLRPELAKLIEKAASANEMSLALMAAKMESNKIDQVLSQAVAKLGRDFDRELEAKIANLTDGV